MRMMTKALEVLNTAIMADPVAMKEILACRVPCSDTMLNSGLIGFRIARAAPIPGLPEGRLTVEAVLAQVICDICASNCEESRDVTLIRQELPQYDYFAEVAPSELRQAVGAFNVAARVARTLTQLLVLDAQALTQLIDSRATCRGSALADHPDVIVYGEDNQPDKIGLLGLINGLVLALGAVNEETKPLRRLQAHYNEAEIIERFSAFTPAPPKPKTSLAFHINDTAGSLHISVDGEKITPDELNALGLFLNNDEKAQELLAARFPSSL